MSLQTVLKPSVLFGALLLGAPLPLLADESATAEKPPEAATEDAKPAGSAKAKTKTVEHLFAEGDLAVQAPEAWKKTPPRNRIIEAEFSIVGKTKEDPTGRLTIMAAGGGIEANLQRWRGQFRPAEGETKLVEPTIEKQEVAGMQVTLFDASGTFLDSPRGPFGPKVKKPDHRMLAAILQTGDSGNYFFKLVGPTKLIEAHAEAFHEMVLSAKKKEP